LLTMPLANTYFKSTKKEIKKAAVSPAALNIYLILFFDL